MDTVSNFTFHSFNIQQGKNVWHLAYFSYHISPPEYDLQFNDICTPLEKAVHLHCIGMVINVI